MKARAKLVCTSVRSTDNGATANPEKTSEQIIFETRYNCEDSQEDNSYSKWTPCANMSMSVTNPDLFGAFEEGKAYYFDIIPA